MLRCLYLLTVTLNFQVTIYCCFQLENKNVKSQLVHVRTNEISTYNFKVYILFFRKLALIMRVEYHINKNMSPHRIFSEKYGGEMENHKVENIKV